MWPLVSILVIKSSGIPQWLSCWGRNAWKCSGISFLACLCLEEPHSNSSSLPQGNDKSKSQNYTRISVTSTTRAGQGSVLSLPSQTSPLPVPLGTASSHCLWDSAQLQRHSSCCKAHTWPIPGPCTVPHFPQPLSGWWHVPWCAAGLQAGGHHSLPGIHLLCHGLWLASSGQCQQLGGRLKENTDRGNLHLEKASLIHFTFSHEKLK